ncbi:MAG: metalloregulator ArsR/SmtB family transcription factor [Rhodospirillaceae bacterium]
MMESNATPGPVSGHQPAAETDAASGSGVDARALDAAAVTACELLKALASPNRLKILCHLVDGEKSVGQVAALVGIREAAASQHLALLRKDRLVDGRRAGQTIYYRMVSPVAAAIIGVLHTAFCAGPSGDKAG